MAEFTGAAHAFVRDSPQHQLSYVPFHPGSYYCGLCGTTGRMPSTGARSTLVTHVCTIRHSRNLEEWGPSDDDNGKDKDGTDIARGQGQGQEGQEAGAGQGQGQGQEKGCDVKDKKYGKDKDAKGDDKDKEGDGQGTHTITKPWAQGCAITMHAGRRTYDARARARNCFGRCISTCITQARVWG